MPLDGLEIGEYCSDFVAVKTDGNLRVRECVYRKHLRKPMTAKLLDASRNYWRKRGVTDWGIVVEKKEAVEADEKQRISFVKVNYSCLTACKSR